MLCFRAVTGACTSEEPPCPLCASSAPPRPLLAVRDQIRDRPGDFAIAECTSCHLAFTSPRPTAEALGGFYEDVYSGSNAERMRAMQTEGGMLWILRARWALLSRFIEPSAEQRLLDIGCGYGAFLRLAGERSSLQLVGCDLDAGSLEGSVAPERAVLHNSDVHEAALPDAHFDIVTLYHCLEHTMDPVRDLKEVRRILKPDGVLLVEVPNFAGLWRRVFGRFWFPLLIPQHLVHFSPETLRAALLQSGFQRIVFQRGFWAPIELVTSVGLVLKSIFGAPPEGRRPVGRWLLHKAFAVLLALLFVGVDIPLSILFANTPLSGHQVAIARRD